MRIRPGLAAPAGGWACKKSISGRRTAVRREPLLGGESAPQGQVFRRGVFSSAILPPWARNIPEDHRGAALALLAWAAQRRLRARPGQFLGSGAGLSGPAITRLTETWKAEQKAFAARDLSGVDYAYLFAPAPVVPDVMKPGCRHVVIKRSQLPGRPAAIAGEARPQASVQRDR